MSESGEAPILGEGARFEGLLVLPHPARIDGHLRGEVLVESAVEVGRSGIVEADLEADEVLVDGQVVGRLRARQVLRLGPGAQIRGDVEADRLAMAEGARIDGRCRVGVPTP